LFSKQSEAVSTESNAEPVSVAASRQDDKQRKMMDEAVKLRRQAAELEVSLREEARAKGLPEEMINKLIPMTSNKPAAASVSSKEETGPSPDDDAAVDASTTVLERPEVIRSKLGYLNVGDAVFMTSELDRLKAKGVIKQWNSKAPSVSSFSMNNVQLKTKTNIEPVDLKLDDVGYNYQNVFIIALGSATVLAISSSFVGGQLGFILGYLSALFPVGLVGVGSIAPGLLGDAINTFKYSTNSAEKDKYIRSNAAKFLAGYVLGLPVSKFSTFGLSNTVEFFQIRPSAGGSPKSDEERRSLAENKFKQADIACSSIVSISGPVAQCMSFGQATASNANDVNTLYELIKAVDPPLSPDKVQDHIRWSAVNAYDLLNARRQQLDCLTDAFSKNLPLEECIALLEATL